MLVRYAAKNSRLTITRQQILYTINHKHRHNFMLIYIKDYLLLSFSLLNIFLLEARVIIKSHIYIYIYTNCIATNLFNLYKLFSIHSSSSIRLNRNKTQHMWMKNITYTLYTYIYCIETGQPWSDSDWLIYPNLQDCKSYIHLPFVPSVLVAHLFKLDLSLFLFQKVLFSLLKSNVGYYPFCYVCFPLSLLPTRDSFFFPKCWLKHVRKGSTVNRRNRKDF